MSEPPSGAFDDDLPAVYTELRNLAGAYMRRERKGHTLQATALVNEAYIRLLDADAEFWHDRRRFLAVAARAMRQILVEHARARGAQKRGGGMQRLSISVSDTPSRDSDLDVLDLHGALADLADHDARKAHVVELRFFGGLSVPEVAEVLGVSQTTAEDDWYFARAWLRRRLKDHHP